MINNSTNISNDWSLLLEKDFAAPYFHRLVSFVNAEAERYNIYPDKSDIFNALTYASFSDVKVVILGQDPYHGKGQANGLAFSVSSGVKLPPSLKNIFTELVSDLGINYPSTGDLSGWAKQGVLLLNTTLTVREGAAGSHQNKGWEIFTDNIIKLLSENKSNVVFVLWGNKAQNKKVLIDDRKHLVITAPHPSPLSVYRGFYGCKHFSIANDYLVSNGLKPIDWNL